MKLSAKLVNAYGSDFHDDGDGKVKLSFYLGRESKYNDKFVHMVLNEKEAEKLIEDMMRVVWENKIDKLS